MSILRDSICPEPVPKCPDFVDEKTRIRLSYKAFFRQKAICIVRHCCLPSMFKGIVPSCTKDRKKEMKGFTIVMPAAVVGVYADTGAICGSDQRGTELQQ